MKASLSYFTSRLKILTSLTEFNMSSALHIVCNFCKDRQVTYCQQFTGIPEQLLATLLKNIRPATTKYAYHFTVAFCAWE